MGEVARDTPRGNKQAKHWNTFATWINGMETNKHCHTAHIRILVRCVSVNFSIHHPLPQVWSRMASYTNHRTWRVRFYVVSLAYRNPAVRNFTTAGLTVVGQLFQRKNLRNIDISRLKSFENLEQEFDVVLPNPVRNSITGLVNRVKGMNRADPATHLPETISTFQSLVRVHSSGCQVATRLLLKNQRQEWEWGDMQRSYSTYLRDDLIEITSAQFSASLCR